METNSSSIERVKGKFIRFFYYCFLQLKVFYDCDTIRKPIGLHYLYNRRMMLDFVILHKVVNCIVDRTALLNYAYLRASQRSSRVYARCFFLVFYTTLLPLPVRNWFYPNSNQT